MQPEQEHQVRGVHEVAQQCAVIPLGQVPGACEVRHPLGHLARLNPGHPQHMGCRRGDGARPHSLRLGERRMRHRDRLAPMRLEHEPRGEVGQDPGPKGPGRIVGKQRERLLQHAGRAGATGVSEVVRLLWEQLGAARGVVGGDRRDRQIDQRQCALPVSGVAERGRRPGEQIGPASPCDLDGVRQLVPHLQGAFAQLSGRVEGVCGHRLGHGGEGCRKGLGDVVRRVPVVGDLGRDAGPGRARPAPRRGACGSGPARPGAGRCRLPRGPRRGGRRSSVRRRPGRARSPPRVRRCRAGRQCR